MNGFKCPNCSHNIIVPNNKDDSNTGDVIIKSRLVFLNKDGNILCRCTNCKKLIGLPISFNNTDSSISSK